MIREKAQNKKTHFEIFSVLIIVATLFMSIAFADVSDIELLINGIIAPQVQYGIFIEDISVSSRTGVVSEEVKYYRGTNLSTSVELSSSSASSLIYEVTLYNNQTDQEAYFAGVTYDKAAYDNKYITYSITGLDPYVTVIHAGERISFTIEFKYTDGLTLSSSQVLNSLLNFKFNNTFIQIELENKYYNTIPDGATWEQWANSEYNAGATISDGKVYMDGKQIYLLGEEVKSTDLIIANETYDYGATITLDKESMEVTIAKGDTTTETLTATLTNIEGDLTWKSSNTSVAEVVGNGSTATVTLKSAGTATITASYGTASATCSITVTEKEITIGSYVNYDVSYTDIYSQTDYTSSNGWRYLGTDDEGNHLLISTGVPLILYYNETEDTNSAQWWDTTQTTTAGKAVEGLMKNFEKIPYAKVSAGTTTTTNTNTMIGLLGDSNKETLGTYFKAIGKTYSSSITVRTLTYEELSNAVSSANKENSSSAEFKDLTGDALGLFDLADIGTSTYDYWVGTVFPDGTSYNNLYWVCDYYTYIYYRYNINSGIRPVVVLPSDIEFEIVDGSWAIKDDSSSGKEYASYNIGDEVTINGEEFYVIEDSDETKATVTLLAKECINTENNLQSASDKNSVSFASSYYWASTATSYPYDLTETGVPSQEHYAAYAAYQYGTKFGGTGRLLTYTEANTLKDSYGSIVWGKDTEDGWLMYWLGTAASSTDPYTAVGSSSSTSGSFYCDSSRYGLKYYVRPVIEVSKDLLITTSYTSYSIGEEVTVNGEEFYVIEDSDESQSTVTLLAKECISTYTLVQSSSANTMAFSTYNSWAASSPEYPVDLSFNGAPSATYYPVNYMAYSYGNKLGADEGRLLTYDEAYNLISTNNSDILYGSSSANGYLDYWTGTVWDDEYVIAVYGEGDLGDDLYSNSHGVRPVIEISKDLVEETEEPNLVSFKVYDRTFYTEEGMTWSEWIESSYNDGYIYIGTFNGYEYVFCCEYDEPIGCGLCTQRQRVEYDGVGNQAGLCWDCQEYVTFFEYPDDGNTARKSFSVCGVYYTTIEWWSWEEWIDSEYNVDGMYIGDDGYVYCPDGEPIGCNTCTRRQLAEYEGTTNISGYCWNCQEYARFEEFSW